MGQVILRSKRDPHRVEEEKHNFTEDRLQMSLRNICQTRKGEGQVFGEVVKSGVSDLSPG